ncbi:TetR family transcriptional regulator [Paenibacillus sp. J31TS4]|uniref:TetR/AcrR family transcriptional regulator n=1 Tax=Paenibacillus sp. J31TS4 TaxID=2807195 RepID=UPI001B1CFA19|nr:TetR/AcrR family transcriptional regulator [Paenibacillus sp. J31TS4]GIP39384.1 TetR family transcriptional regulator [Paenibacillus sp. J31TS4]
MRREERKKRTREEIIRQAIELFKQKGYHHVTVEEIASACGIAKGTFFNYFARKEQVLLHMANSYLPLMNQLVERSRGMAPKERVLHLLRDLLAIYFQYGELLSLTLAETIRAAIETKDESANLQGLEKALAGMLSEAKEAGTLAARWESERMAAVIAAVFFHTLIGGVSTLTEKELGRQVERQLDIVWEGIHHV